MASPWSALAAWSGVELDRPLAGGHRNLVMLASRGSDRVVVRRSTRPAESVEWELELLEYLGRHGLLVPAAVPADDGRRHLDGLLVTQFLDGRPPADNADWKRVTGTLAAFHELTIGWPQRPGSASSRQLLARDRGGDVRLDAMPVRAVDAVRAAWRAVDVGEHCAVHGDVSPDNILVDGDRVALIDWDEARADVPWFDFAFVPDAAGLPEAAGAPAPPTRQAIDAAGMAWEAATCWTAEPYYARRRLWQLYQCLARSGR